MNVFFVSCSHAVDCANVFVSQPWHSICYQIAYAPSKDSDQHVHPHRVIWVFAVRLKTFRNLVYLQSALQRLCGFVTYKTKCVQPANYHILILSLSPLLAILSLLPTFLLDDTKWSAHYENTPIQIYWKFYHQVEAVLTSTHNLCFEQK